MRAVVLDLETSWLSSKEDSIIEVAVLKFDTDTGELEEWTSLINPGFVIQEEITFLTSITPEQLVSAPYFEEVLGTLQRFVGDLPIIGHNVSFDVDFLVENGFDLGFRPIIDTFHLANFLYSDLKSLNLSNIVEDLGYIHADAHRAMSDVRATKFLFDAELEKMKNFTQEEYNIFASVSARTQNSPLDYIHGFIAPRYQVMELSTELGMKQFFSSPLERLKMSQMVPSWDKKLFFDDINSKERIETVLEKIHLEAIAEKNNLEKRPEQFRMSDLILETFQSSKHICIEAPTGVWKTFSYLVPAIRTALTTGKTVCVSTNTKTLQDQICLRDIPKVLSLLEKEGIKSIRFQKLKGRNNYLSWLKFFEFFEQVHFTPEESYFALKIAFWSLKTESWELDELMMYGGEFQLMQEVSASDLRVTSPENNWKEYEFLLMARTRLNTAHIAVLNHALLLSEYLEDSQIGILPKLEHLVLDEVHNLESVASDTLRATCSAEDIGKTVQDIEKIIRKYNRDNPTVPFLDPLITSSTQWLLLAAGDFYGLCTNCMSAKRESIGWYWKGKTTDMLIESDTLTPLRADMILAKSALFERIHELEAAAFWAPEKLAWQLGRYIDILYGYHDHIALFVSEEQKNTIRILTKREHTEVQTVTIPLSVWDILQERLWNKVPSIVMTSATLCINNSFEYIQKVLHINDFEFHILATDFDYSKQSLLYIPTGFWDIRKNEQKHAIENFLKELLWIYKGRTLMLFTSFASIKEMAVSLAKHMKGIGVDILPQGLGWWKHRLALAFTKNAHKSILLGTDSFWEGVDFPWNLLELLVIYKLPFSVPTDPVIVARSRLYKDSFQEYALPMMILKLRQGIGRLIRTKNDKGVIVVMDSRITAPWGNTILESLPVWMPVRQASPEIFLAKLKEKQADVNMNSR